MHLQEHGAGEGNLVGGTYRKFRLLSPDAVCQGVAYLNASSRSVPMPITPAKFRVLKQSKLEKRAKPGTIIYACIEYTYGVVRDDNRAFGIKHGAFTLKPDGGYPFFTMPMSDVEKVV
jgi:hypothetical protein